MSPTTPPDENSTILSILKDSRVIAVVGLSPKPERDSHHVAEYLQQQGYRIVPINPQATEILGERCWPSLTEAAQHEPITLVNCFRNSVDIPPIVDEAIAIGAKAVWMQLGIAHPEAAAKATAAGLLVVQDRCIKIDYRVLVSSGLVKPLPA